MGFTKYLILALLFLGSHAVAQVKADKIKPLRRTVKTDMLFYWQRAEGATAYQLIAKANRADNKKCVGKLTIAETTDSFVSINKDSHLQELNKYTAKYKAKKKKCAADPKCKLNYNYYLVVVSGRKKGKAIPFRMLWDK